MLQNFVPKNGRRLFGTQNLPYVILNVGKLNEDMKEKYYRKGSKLREEYGSIGRTLIINGVNDSVITNARASYRAYKELIHAACDIPEGADPGRMREDYYKCILKAFRLKDVYASYPNVYVLLDRSARLILI